MMSCTLPRRELGVSRPVNLLIAFSSASSLLDEGRSNVTGGSIDRLEVEFANGDRPRGESLVGEMDLARSGRGRKMFGLACVGSDHGYDFDARASRRAGVVIRASHPADLRITMDRKRRTYRLVSLLYLCALAECVLLAFLCVLHPLCLAAPPCPESSAGSHSRLRNCRSP